MAQPGLCPACWDSVQHITAPRCNRCGNGFADEHTSCSASCIWRDRPFTYGRSAAFYHSGIRSLLLAFKNGGGTDLAPFLAGLLLRSGADILPKVDALVPVPLHPLRLLRRRYNQSRLLAEELSRKTQLRVLANTLKRSRMTPKQQGSFARRWQNTRGAFSLRGSVAGLHVLLIDDVLTSGATVTACAEALFKGGAAQVSFLTVARTRAAIEGDDLAA